MVVNAAVVLPEAAILLGTNAVVTPLALDVALKPEHRRRDGLRGPEAVFGHIALARADGHDDGDDEKEGTEGDENPREQFQNVLPVFAHILTFLKKSQ